ncbi:MAG: hypothetical protein KDH97_17145 [Calditrichaeota bacterium]|nr:hypothetical protein [Calditrichota bacterium]MCB0291983.1 hypothetical protein [Calditrichota bacterium]MCB0303413.1 hypothetical protein [Calditrichota bacterium]MCB0312739.1 hypothetical protein [Calditrichota bacterium]MCB9089376.1 hypothetical protein [Calditrichia bacterium]
MTFHPDSMSHIEFIDGLFYDHGYLASAWYQKYDENDQVVQRSFFMDGKKLRTELFGPNGLEVVYEWDEDGELIEYEDFREK